MYSPALAIHVLMMFKFDSFPRLGQNLLLCVLEAMPISVLKDKHGREDVFRKMLEWCDVSLVYRKK